MIGPMSPEQAKAYTAKLAGKGLDNVLQNGLRRYARRVKRRATEEIGSRGIGRRIWGKKPKGLQKILSTSRIEREGPAAWAIKLTGKGLPAFIEEGGKTAAHTIKAYRRGPKGRRLLSFREKGGTGAVPEVRHPGSNIQKRPWIQPAIDAEAAQAEREFAAALDIFAES